LAAWLTFCEMFRSPPCMPLLRFGSLGREKPCGRDFPGRALRTLSSAPPRRPLVIDRATTAPARPARAAPPASSGVFARFATSPTLLAADPTLLAPLAAVSLTVPPTAPAVLRPFREVLRPLRDREVDPDRDVLDDEDRPRDEGDRPPLEARELEVFRELDAFCALDAVFVLLLLPAPFLEVLLERLDVLRRRLVLAFACAISFFLRLGPLLKSGFHFRVTSTYPP
jgi:hypothetical protein